MKIAKCGIKRDPGYLYYIDKNGNIARVKMARGGSADKKSKPEVVKVLNLKREADYLFYIDKDGDVSSVKMADGGETDQSEIEQTNPVVEKMIRNKVKEEKGKRKSASNFKKTSITKNKNNKNGCKFKIKKLKNGWDTPTDAASHLQTTKNILMANKAIVKYFLNGLVTFHLAQLWCDDKINELKKIENKKKNKDKFVGLRNLLVANPVDLLPWIEDSYLNIAEGVRDSINDTITDLQKAFPKYEMQLSQYKLGYQATTMIHSVIRSNSLPLHAEINNTTLHQRSALDALDIIAAYKSKDEDKDDEDLGWLEGAIDIGIAILNPLLGGARAGTRAINSKREQNKEQSNQARISQRWESEFDEWYMCINRLHDDHLTTYYTRTKGFIDDMVDKSYTAVIKTIDEISSMGTKIEPYYEIISSDDSNFLSLDDLPEDYNFRHHMVSQFRSQLEKDKKDKSISPSVIRAIECNLGEVLDA